MTETQTTPIRLRPFAEHDYPAVAAVERGTDPDWGESEAEPRHYDANWDAARHFRERLVAEDPAGQVVGWGAVRHMPYYYHPDRYRLHIAVTPERQRQGIGSRLYERLLVTLTERGAEVARASARENDEATMRFLARRGFVEVQRELESRLDVAGFDFDRFASAEPRVAEPGIVITTLAAERERDSAALTKVYELFCVCDRDVPSVDAYTPVPFDRFVPDTVEAPGALADAFFLARDGDRYVGVSNLYVHQREPDVLNQGLTGVRPEYRGRGIAMALKLQTIRYAREHGYREIRTGNDSRNQPMLRINTALGFVRQPAWLELDKALGG